jgi:hypothetical protein
MIHAGQSQPGEMTANHGAQICVDLVRRVINNPRSFI